MLGLASLYVKTQTFFPRAMNLLYRASFSISSASADYAVSPNLPFLLFAHLSGCRDHCLGLSFLMSGKDHKSLSVLLT